MVAFLVCVFVLVLISVGNLWLYALDKQRAKNGGWRIPEKLLLAVGFFGGAIGGLCGMGIFRHKTKHWYFYLVNIVGVLWQVVLAAYLAAVGI
jgi:uncharacterized membrane protein YsdA (DUF1294 family)